MPSLLSDDAKPAAKTEKVEKVGKAGGEAPTSDGESGTSSVKDATMEEAASTEDNKPSDAAAASKHSEAKAEDPNPSPPEATATTTTSTTNMGGGKSLGKVASKKASRTTSPTNGDAGTAAQAIAAANLAAAVQMAASLQMNGLLSLLTQSSAPGAASAADPTVLQAASLVSSASLISGNSGWQIPTPDQVRHASLKAVQELPPFVHLSKADSAPQLKILETDRLTLKGGMRGYRMSRATHGVSSGCYYYEVLVQDPPSIHEIVNSLPANARLGPTLQKQIQRALEDAAHQKRSSTQPSQADNSKNAEKEAITEDGKRKVGRDNEPPTKRAKGIDGSSQSTKQTHQVGGHLRIGWSMRTGDLQAPVGYDKWSYGYRNISGSKIHESRREDNWGGESWGPGDVVGFAICINESDATGSSGNTTATASGTAAASASATNTSSTTSNLNNHIRFFKNGQPTGRFVITKGKREGGAAFENIESGTYYPAISSYLGGAVQANFGPHFIYPPRKLPHGMSGGKLLPISSLQPPPLTQAEITQRLKKKVIFNKIQKEKETPEMKMAAFKEAVLAESQVLTEAYEEHRKKHLRFVMEARKARNLNVSDLQQEFEELTGTSEENNKEGGTPVTKSEDMEVDEDDAAPTQETIKEASAAADDEPVKAES